jgi:hypothetical protein
MGKTPQSKGEIAGFKFMLGMILFILDKYAQAPGCPHTKNIPHRIEKYPIKC